MVEAHSILANKTIGGGCYITFLGLGARLRA